jgi:hypothetical protein
LLDPGPAAVVIFADMASRYYVLPVFLLVELSSPAGSSFA